MAAYVLDGADASDVEYVVSRMRLSDRDEAVAFGLQPDLEAPAVVHNAADVYTAYLNDLPVFVFGTHSVIPGVRQLFGFGTDQTRRAIPHVTWFTNNYWLPELFDDRGTRRIQAMLPDTSLASIRWLQNLGMYREATLLDYAVDGAPVVQLAYTRREYDLNVLAVQKSTNSNSDPADSAACQVKLGDSEGSRRSPAEKFFFDAWSGSDDPVGGPRSECGAFG